MIRIWSSCMVMLLTGVSGAWAQTTAFYYGPSVPPELSAAYDQIVIEPGHKHDLAALLKAHAVPVAYLSIGELSSDKQRASAIDPAWRLGRNEAWASTVMDVSHPGYRAYVTAYYEQLWAAGYRRFFLDTLDSYQLGAKDAPGRERLRKALCTLIKSLAERHPQARWLLNRGFELLPDLNGVVHGVVAESLFDRWDAAKASYVRVPEADRTWLLAKLREVRERAHLPVIVIDYRPASEREEARATARKIAQLGFQPWITNGALTDSGVGPLEILPRKVLIVSDRPDAGAQLGTGRYLAPVLEYLGYVPEYVTVEALPGFALNAHYAGIISVFEPGFSAPGYESWLATQLHAGVRVAIFGGLGLRADGALARELGVRVLPAVLPGAASRSPLAFTTRAGMIGFEAEPPLHEPDGVPLQLEGTGVQRQLELRTGSGRIATLIATGPFGGIAASHVFARRGLGAECAWVLDPFLFLTHALALPALPAPDVSTESGRRVALFAVVATGLGDVARMRGRPAIAGLLRERILRKYPWPHALDLHGDGELSARDRSAAEQLIASQLVEPAEISAGTTAERGAAPSLTGVQPLWAADGVPFPMAPDASFYGAVSEAYPLRRMLETFAFTEHPRRLRPLALHYHAFALGSPGGLAALEAVYAAIAAQRVFPLGSAEYAERVAAFRVQVIARDLAGGYAVFGGEALRTLRLPEALGTPDLTRSLAVAGFRAEGRYVTFSARGPRQLALAAQPARTPQLIESNGRVDQFELSGRAPTCLQLELSASSGLELRIGGLPADTACELSFAARRVHARTDRSGELQLKLVEHSTGPAVLRCAEAAS